jgi:ABC-type uncharacterized transport system involved in gliding motility auxiliary subunit
MQPCFLFVDDKGINTGDVVTSQTDQLMLPFAGGFTGTPAEGLEQTILIHSTDQSQLVDAFMARLSGEQVLKDFKAEDKEYSLGMRLTGSFKTAFPEGKPGADAEDDLDSEDPQPPADEPLKESKQGAAVLLYADADFLYDSFGVSQQNFLGARMVQLLNGNVPLVQASVEQMAGDERLITVRGRATMTRPFTRIREMQEQARDSYQAKINELEEKKREAEQKINDIQRTRQDANQGQRFVLTPEQQQELEKLRETNKQVATDLKEMRRNLRKDVDSLQNRLKWTNIAAVPALVTLFGLVSAYRKSKKTAAR